MLESESGSKQVHNDVEMASGPLQRASAQISLEREDGDGLGEKSELELGAG
jgi:hypothetical protein